MRKRPFELTPGRDHVPSEQRNRCQPDRCGPIEFWLIEEAIDYKYGERRECERDGPEVLLPLDNSLTSARACQFLR